ncbi:helix-turn-helix domain-containing protein [Gallibacterium anatis]|uniref:Transcriptional regulator n=1 Tax=Gallibacterium anatis TaxID=750 RepID=A0A1A7PBE9_9PAST|nr:helix-turn-helix transcriptional regulator [Gallibacterium anatis]OBW97290.1 transcriptional regulator [Gallibacterium anatis]OBW99031.1 transcriptional regulator [Gallibacterium anatis]
MTIQEKIRKLREQNHWSQEEMAEKMGMSLNGYSKIERGETKLYMEKLEQIAQIFNIDIVELIDSNEKNICFVIGENSNLSSNYYGGNDQALIAEIEKLRLMLQHKDDLLAQKQLEINRLDKIIQLLEAK